MERKTDNMLTLENLYLFILILGSLYVLSYLVQVVAIILFTDETDKPPHNWGTSER